MSKTGGTWFGVGELVEVDNMFQTPRRYIGRWRTTRGIRHKQSLWLELVQG